MPGCDGSDDGDDDNSGDNGGAGGIVKGDGCRNYCE